MPVKYAAGQHLHKIRVPSFPTETKVSINLYVKYGSVKYLKYVRVIKALSQQYGGHSNVKKGNFYKK